MQIVQYIDILLQYCKVNMDGVFAFCLLCKCLVKAGGTLALLVAVIVQVVMSNSRLLGAIKLQVW